MKKSLSIALVFILVLSMLTACGGNKNKVVDGKMHSSKTLEEKETFVQLFIPSEYETEFQEMDEESAEYLFYASAENPYGSFEDAVSWYENTLDSLGFVSTVSETTLETITPIMDKLFTGTIDGEPVTILIENLPPRPDGEVSFVIIHIIFYAFVIEDSATSSGGNAAGDVSEEEEEDTPPVEQISKESKPGDLIQFGEYVWRVLDVADGKALILTEGLIEQGMFNSSIDGNVYWQMSELREYLNGEFYESFSSTDRVSILDTVLENPVNQWYEWKEEWQDEGKISEPTIDKIFLLSVDEVLKYFGDSGHLASGQKDDDGCIDDQYNEARIAIDIIEGSNYYGEAFYWYLRSPGGSSSYAVCVKADGRISMIGAATNQDATRLRPALWLTVD